MQPILSKMISSNKLAMKWTCFAIIIQFLDLRHFPPPSSQNCKGRQGFQWFWHHHHQNNHWGTRLWMSLRFIFFAIFLGDARKWFLAASKHRRRVRTSRQPVEPEPPLTFKCIGKTQVPLVGAESDDMSKGQANSSVPPKEYRWFGVSSFDQHSRQFWYLQSSEPQNIQ